jgi:hypothetical protein
MNFSMSLFRASLYRFAGRFDVAAHAPDGVAAARQNGAHDSEQQDGAPHD